MAGGTRPEDYRLPILARWRPWQRLGAAYALLTLAMLLWYFTIHGKSGAPPNPVTMFLESAATMVLIWVLIDLFNHEYGPEQVAMVTWASIAVGAFLGQIGSTSVIESMLFAALLGGATYGPVMWTLRRRARRAAQLPPPPPPPAVRPF